MVFRKSLIFGFFILILVFGCTANNEQHSKQKITVVTSFYPIYDITKNITEQKADVSSLVPAGVEPHDYEPTPNQIIDLNNAHAYVVLGAGFEGIEDKIESSLENNVKIIKASEGIKFSPETDPHIWLSPKRMIIITTNIKNGLESVDPNSTSYYENKSAAYIKELEKLDQEYRVGLANCKQNTILTTHRAFAYLASDYGFKQLAISGLYPETEPNAKDLTTLIDIVKKQNIKYIFYEALVDPRVSQTIAVEAGAQTLELNPIEGTKNLNENYFTMMRKNLANLKVAMDCG